MEAERLRIAIFSRIVTGGAGYAALRVHDALRRLEGANSTLYVGRAEHRRHEGMTRLRDAAEGCQPPIVPGMTMFSVDPPGLADDALRNIAAQSDAFNLHWAARFLSLRNVAQLSRSGKPVVLTVRDMNPLTGGCHFFHGCAHWMKNCLPCPQFNIEHLPLPNATFEAKESLWNFDNITVVVLSDHSARLVENSPLFRHCRIEKIPNPMDVSVFRPHDREHARSRFRVPPHKRVIAYLPSFGSAVKGSAQAVQSLKALAGKISPESCVVLCAGELDAPLDVPFETVNVGFIHNKKQLAQFYSAANVTLIPSTEETFSNTAAESVSCGTPIVGFQVGAIPEIAQGPRGRAVCVNDIDGLAESMRDFAFEDRANPADLHRYVADTFDIDTVGRRYLALFEDLCANAHSRLRGDTSAGTAANLSAGHFDDLLAQYREERAPEMEDERRSLARERRGLRGAMTLLVRAAKLFFSDNATFRSKARTFLTGR